MSVYIRLFHGRNSPDEELDDWGFDGPVLGPFDGIHTTYQHHVRPIVNGDQVGEIRYVEDCLHYDGKYYGDWTVISDPLEPSDQARLEEPTEEKFNPKTK